MSKKWIGIALFGGWFALFGFPLARLIGFSYQSNFYTHIMLIPIVSGYIIWVNRKRLSLDPSAGWSALSVFLIVFGLLAYLASFRVGQFVDTKEDALFVVTLAALMALWGIFLGYFGRKCFKLCLFPLLLLAFMVPLPSVTLDALIRFLQLASAGTANFVFMLLDIPFLREGTTFTLPGMAVNVAPECSGIRSFFALMVLGIVAAYMFLNSNKRRLIFIAAILPVTIFKNALRIVLLAYLGAYVNPGFVTDSILHRQGGKPFMFVACMMLIPLFWALRRNEKRAVKKKDCAKRPYLQMRSEPVHSVTK